MKVLNICNLYTIAFFIFNFLGGLGSDLLISKFLLVFILFVGIIYSCIVLIKYKMPIIFKGVNVFFLLLIVYGLINILLNKTYYVSTFFTYRKVPSYYFLLKSLLSFLPLYTYYYFSIKKYISVRWIKICFIFLLVSATSSYIMDFQKQFIEDLQGSDGYTLNASYSFLFLLPYLYFFKSKPLLQFSLLGYLSLLILLGMKRGAILIFIICLLLFLYHIQKSFSSFAKLRLYVIIIIFISIIGYQTIELYNNNVYFLERVQATIDGNSSGRDVIYSNLFNHFAKSGFHYLLLGHGGYSTLPIHGQYAHQDWLELAIDCGILGLFSYSLFYLKFLKNIKAIKHNIVRNILLQCFLILFLKSLFSMGYENIGQELGILISFCVSTDRLYKHSKEEIVI